MTSPTRPDPYTDYTARRAGVTALLGGLNV
jgi:hypothetical protein